MVAGAPRHSFGPPGSYLYCLVDGPVHSRRMTAADGALGYLLGSRLLPILPCGGSMLLKGGDV